MERTVLHEHLSAAGAVHRDEGSIALPARFGSAAAEYAALRTEATVIDLGFRTVVRATGADRVEYLQGMLTGDVAVLDRGEGCAALLLTIQARVTADLRVAVLDDEIWLDVDVRARATLLEALEALIIADDVELVPAEGQTLIGIEGPRAASLLPVLEELAPFASRVVEVAGVPVWVLHTSILGAQPGGAVVVPARHAATVWDVLVDGGGVPCGMDALESRRIELGVPRIGVDMGATTLALELPLAEAISSTKGCYLGQEVVARASARGHINRRLCGLVFEGSLPPVGAALGRDGKKVGQVSSVVQSLGLGRPVGIGLVRRECWEPGTELVAGDGDAETAAWVAEIPLA